MTRILEGKCAVITGAGRGIGAAIAEIFAKEGARLVLAARSTAQLEEVAAGIGAKGGEAYAVATDMSNPTSVEALASATLEKLGGVDIVVSNAATSGVFTPFTDVPLESWREVYETNVVGPVVLLQKLGPHLVGRPGANAIIVSSIRGLGGTPNHSPYGTSKATLNQLTKTLACEWGPKGVRVNAVLPGPVDTTMTTAMLPKELYDAYANIAPLAGWTMAEDLAGPALFLASDMARRVTGHLLVVDAGLSGINQDAFPPPPAKA